MKYKLPANIIPQDERAGINETILALINSTDLQGITPQDIYEGYTGIGGLHGLDRSAFDNYSEFSDAKKEIENGQFFTPGHIIEQIAQLLQPRADEFICDLTCGTGAFFNSFQEAHCHGNEFDLNAVDVGRFLYPQATIVHGDIKYYRPAIRFDYVLGNPPFNLEWSVDGDTVRSQHYYCKKASEILKPGGLMVCVVPASYLADEFFNKSAIQDLNEQFNFLFQYSLPSDSFASMGVKKFDTKVICFQRHSRDIGHVPYSNTFMPYDDAVPVMIKIQEERSKLRIKLQAEFLEQTDDQFLYKVRKYLYEIKTHRVLKEHYPKPNELFERFKTQVRPPGMEVEEWNKTKLTENKVLSAMRRIVKKQNAKPVNKVCLVKTQYGFKLKAYSDKAKHTLNKQTTHVSMNDLITGMAEPDIIGSLGPFVDLIRKKRRRHLIETCAMGDLGRHPALDAWLKRFVFISPKDEKAYEFNDKQLNDMGLLLQKHYSILNWQQGSGKSAAAFSWAQYWKMRNTFIIAPAVATHLTWARFLKLNNVPFIHVQKLKHFYKIKPGDFVVMSFDLVIRHERHIKAYIKRCAYKVSLVMDESDEITSAISKRTRATLSCFRKVKRKLLTTGTTTRNNITELYSQLELLYNNSVNMLCRCETIFSEETVKVKDAKTSDEELEAGTKIRERNNRYYLKPFPPYYGPNLFKACFNPGKSSVFGIEKHDQDIYNEGALRDIIGQSVITRKFRDIAGDKYKVNTLRAFQTMAERHIYRKIISEVQSIIPAFFSSTGSSRKDNMLRIIRQLNLLIKATSMPQSFADYHGDPIPSKARIAENWVRERDCKVAIGVTSIETLNFYGEFFAKTFPERPLFSIEGEISFKNRGSIITDFEATENGILVCTQQSLRSSVNIPGCNEVLLESLQWNVPKMEQFYFRFIRYDSEKFTNVWFLNYEGTIEMNLLALLMAKEKLNDYIKTLEYREDSDIYDEFGIDTDILNSLLTKEKDKDGHFQVNWGAGGLV